MTAREWRARLAAVVRRRDLERDFYLSAEEARAYGIIDTVLVNTNRNGARTADVARPESST